MGCTESPVNPSKVPTTLDLKQANTIIGGFPVPLHSHECGREWNVSSANTSKRSTRASQTLNDGGGLEIPVEDINGTRSEVELLLVLQTGLYLHPQPK
jgi:hypothetical protein